MNIAVIGSGYVGIVTALGLANKNFNVTNIDINKTKVENIKKKNLTIKEPGLNKLFLKHLNKKYFVTTEYEKCLLSDCIFLAVNTPHKKNGIDLSYLISSCKKIKNLIKKKNIKKKIIIIVKSTVVPGTLENKIKPLFMEFPNIYVTNNPEFLREGSAVKDFINADRIIIGSKEKYVVKNLKRIYRGFKAKKFFVSPTEAELCKYYSNLILSNLIAFSNEFADVCAKFQKDVSYNKILESFMYDRRFNIKLKNKFFFPEIYKYLIPGPGYGGSCFPKDTKSFYKFAETKKLNSKILKSIIDQNNKRLENKVKQLKNFKNFCIIGVGFKEGTSDLRESKSIELMNILKPKSENIFYVDKNVDLKNKSFKKIDLKKLSEVKIDAVVIMNHTTQTKKYNWKTFSKRKNCYVFDFRAILKPSEKIKVVGSNF